MQGLHSHHMWALRLGADLSLLAQGGLRDPLPSDEQERLLDALFSGMAPARSSPDAAAACTAQQAPEPSEGPMAITPTPLADLHAVLRSATAAPPQGSTAFPAAVHEEPQAAHRPGSAPTEPMFASQQASQLEAGQPQNVIGQQGTAEGSASGSSSPRHEKAAPASPQLPPPARPEAAGASRAEHAVPTAHPRNAPKTTAHDSSRTLHADQLTPSLQSGAQQVEARGSSSSTASPGPCIHASEVAPQPQQVSPTSLFGQGCSTGSLP